MAGNDDEQERFDLTPPPTDPRINETELLRAAYVEQGKELGNLQRRVTELEHHFADLLRRFDELLQELGQVVRQLNSSEKPR